MTAKKGALADHDEILRRYQILTAEANTVRDRDRMVVRSLFRNFHRNRLRVGMGFRRSYGAVLSGDYFDLVPLPDGTYLFIFADLSGHGLPAYTNLVRLRSAVILSVKELSGVYQRTGIMDTTYLVKDICTKFTDILDASRSEDFACVNFTFISEIEDGFHFRFYNHSMLFPILARRTGEAWTVTDLNLPSDDWQPHRGFLLGSDMRRLTDAMYLDTRPCDLVLHEGDAIFFYSDGITEASGELYPAEFGEDRLMSILRDSRHLPPQDVVDIVFASVDEYIGDPSRQKDDMTSVMIVFRSSSNL